MNQKLAKHLRRLAKCSVGADPGRYLLDTRKGRAVWRPGVSLESWQHGPTRPPAYLYTRLADPRSTRGYYRHLKRIWS